MTSPSSPAQTRVWDLFVRVFHWSLVTCFAVAYFTASGPRKLHEWLGYATLALLASRLVWGFVGSKYARFSEFVPGPSRLWHYVRSLLKGQEPRHLGHNPAAAVMIVFLLLMVGSIGVTGWMLTLDAFWGDESIEELHALLVHITLGAVALHVSAAIYESLRHRENLIAAMFTGRKRPL